MVRSLYIESRIRFGQERPEWKISIAHGEVRPMLTDYVCMVKERVFEEDILHFCKMRRAIE